MDYNQIKAIPTEHLDQINRFTFSVDLLKAAIRQKVRMKSARRDQEGEVERWNIKDKI